MKENLLSILLDQKSIQSLFDIFEKESIDISLVGGCVRDALLGKISRDIDIAANLKPDKIINILNKNNLAYEDYAFKYGSITTFIDDKKFQITALREDINQTGRHTNIIYTNDWKKDASRRDFTINAIYLFRTGQLKDFFNGQQDLANSTIRFIKNIDNSIQEDFLRIFRYYRFLGVFKNPKIIEKYEEIISEYCDRSFTHLSNDLIRQEILKMFNMPFPLNSFFNKNNYMKKKYWIQSTKKHFFQTGYEIGLSRCMNKIDLLIN